MICISLLYFVKIHVLKDGHIVGDGAPQEVLTKELLKKIYEMNCEIVEDSKGQMYILFTQ